MTDNVKTAAHIATIAAEKSVLRKCTLSKPADSAVMRSEISMMRLGGETALRLVTYMKDGKAIQKNVSADELCAFFEENSYGQINIITTLGECELRRSKSGKVTLLGGDRLLRAIGADVSEDKKLAPESNDRKKNRILTGDEPFLYELGISDKNGRIHDKKQGKFRQICRFLEYVRDIEEHLPTDGELRICDLCCGKSYLSFALYHYFAIAKNRKVSMTGVDLKPDVVDYCNRVCESLGFSGLEFICGDAIKYETETPPSLVVSLHACDIATDIVLHRAADWGAKVILSTPCCHHELANKINCEPLGFVSAYPMLKRKMCDALTDAARLAFLKSRGYAVSAAELVDPDDTPKNVLLRAVRKKNFDPTSREAKRAAAEYEEIKRFLVGDEKLFADTLE